LAVLAISAITNAYYNKEEFVYYVALTFLCNIMVYASNVLINANNIKIYFVNNVIKDLNKTMDNV
jgi:hypothetical protein